MDAGYLECGGNAGCDECGGNEVLGDFGVEVECSACDGEGWGDDGPDHCEGMLKTEEHSEEDWDLVVQAVEWCFIVFVFAVQGPDIGRDEVEVVL